MSWFDLVLLLAMFGLLATITRRGKPPKRSIDVYVLPGGHLPERQTDGAIGYDVYLRAIVSAFEMEPDGILRKTIFDFISMPPDLTEEMLKHIQTQNEKGEVEVAYWLYPGESVLVGIGFITAMPFPMLYWVAPRSGLASKHRINLANAPGTVDPDYRGEAGVIVVNEGDKPFKLTRGMRIAQVIFGEAIIPDIQLCSDRAQLGSTRRGSGGFGSTGL